MKRICPLTLNYACATTHHREVMIGLYRVTSLSLTTRHVGKLWHKLRHFMWH